MNRRRFAKAVVSGCAGYVAFGDYPVSDPGGTGPAALDRFNVRDFGAIGNGSADDTRAFHLAIARASRSGGAVVVPGGRYRVKQSIHLADGVVLQGLGPNSVIAHPDGEPIVIVCVDAREAGIQNLTIGGKFSFAVLIERCSAVAVNQCRISGGTVGWLTSRYCGGIFLVQSNDITLEGNELYANGFVGNGFLSSDIQVNGFGDNVSSRGIHIIRNRCLSTATQCCISAYDVQRSEISDNVCSGAKTGPGNNNGYGILIYQRPGSPGSCTDNSVERNTVSGTQGSAIYLQQCHRSRVIGNTIDKVADIQDDQTLPVGGVALNQSQHALIAENRITNVGRAGISIASNKTGVGHVEVSQNVISDVKGMGIHLRGLLTDIRVSRNTVTRAGGGIGSYTADPQDLISLVDNSVTRTSSTSPGIILGNATRSVIKKNRISDSGGFGLALTLRDEQSEVSDNIVVRSGRAFGGKYPDTRIVRGKRPAILR